MLSVFAYYKNNLLRLVNSVYILFFLLSILYLHGSWAEKIHASLSLREKVGQLFVAACWPHESKKTYRTDREYIEYLIKEYHIGGIIYLGRSHTTEEQQYLTQWFQSISTHPLLVGVDCECGVPTVDGFKFPQAMTLGAMHDYDLIYETAKEIGHQCRRTGATIGFAPVADVNSNPLNPIIGKRSFGNDPLHVAHCCIHFARGLSDAGIIPCAKHFPGHGDNSLDSHHALITIDHTIRTLIQCDLVQFYNIIETYIPDLISVILVLHVFD